MIFDTLGQEFAEIACNREAFMIDFEYRETYGYKDLLDILRILRAPGGCPWDREQTHESLKRNFLEETYEAVDAIDSGDSHALCEELGDVLMQVVLHAQIDQEQGGFTMDDVVDGVCKKLIYRHPHVFGGGMQAEDSETVLVNWEALKRSEKGQASTADAIDSVAHALPSLWRAEKIQSKAAKAGFDWPAGSAAADKLWEEAQELRRAQEAELPPDGPHGAREEAGDLLFAAVNVVRRAGVDPEEALHSACEKFSRRFREVESQADRPLNQMNSEDLAALWRRAKEQS